MVSALHAPCCLLWLFTAAATAAPAPPQSYERYLPPQQLPAETRALAHVVRAFGHRRHLSLRYDWRLMAAAGCQLQTLDAWGRGPLQLSTISRCAQDLGWTDGELSAVQVTSTHRALARALAWELKTALGQSEATAMGLALLPPSAKSGGQATVVVALSRRLLRLSPVPKRLNTKGQLNLTGTLELTDIKRVVASVRCPQGNVVSRPLAVVDGHFMGTVGVGNTGGTLQVELLVERGRGPEVAAAFPVQVLENNATAPAPEAAASAHPADFGGPPESAEAPQPGAPTADLLALVWGARASHNLPLPAVSQNLMVAAGDHALDMAQHQFFAHVSPTLGVAGDVTKRLARLREPYRHVVENLAADDDIPQAFAQWLSSPGHLANLLDPRVDHVGVGVARASAQPGGPCLIVLVMSQRP